VEPPPLGRDKLPEVDETQIDEAISRLKSILQEIHEYFNGPEADFPFPVLEGCAGQLMRLLEDGVSFRRAEVDAEFP
jgi:hypothetical protein